MRPTPTQELILQAALAEDERASEAWHRLRPALHLDELEEGSYPVLPLLYRRLHDLGISDPTLPRLRGIYRRTWVENRLALPLLREVLEALGAVGVAALVVNDVSVATRFYAELGLRVISEVELVLRPSDAASAQSALEPAGWRRAGRGGAAELAIGSTDGLRLERADAPTTVVLRSHPLAGAAVAGSLASVQEGLWERAVEIRVDGVPALAPSAADALLYACVEGVAGRWWRKVQCLADAVVILRDEEAIDWPRLLRTAAAERLLLPLGEALSYLAWLVDAPIPSGRRREVATSAVTMRERVAHRLGRSSGPLVGYVPSLLGHHLRLTASQSAVRAAAQIPGFLTRAWGLEHWWSAPSFMVAALVRRGRRPRRRQ